MSDKLIFIKILLIPVSFFLLFTVSLESSIAQYDENVYYIDIVNPFQELNETLYDVHTEYEVRGNLLKVRHNIQLNNIKNFTYINKLQSYDRNTILDYSLKINDVEKVKIPIIPPQKIKKENYTVFVNNLPSYEAGAGDNIFIEYSVTDKIKSSELDIFTIKLNGTDFFFPFDSYYFDGWRSPSHIYGISAKVIFPNSFHIDTDETYLKCPVIFGAGLFQNRTEVASFMLIYPNRTSTSDKTFIESDDNLFVVFNPIVSSQSALMKIYSENSYEYIGNEEIGCKIEVRYERTDLIKLIFTVSFLFLIIIALSMHFFKDKRLELLSFSFVVWSFQEILLPFNGLQRPFNISLFDLSILPPILSFVALSKFKSNLSLINNPLNMNNRYNAYIILVFVVVVGYFLANSYGKLPEFIVSVFGVLIAFMLASISNEIIREVRDSGNLKKILSKLMDELEKNYQILSNELPNEILNISTYESAKINNSLDLLDYDTAYKLGELYEKLHRINDDVSRLLNFVYSSAQSLSSFAEHRDLLQEQIKRERSSAKDLASHIIGLIMTKYHIPSKINLNK